MKRINHIYNISNTKFMQGKNHINLEFGWKCDENQENMMCVFVSLKVEHLIRVWHSYICPKTRFASILQRISMATSIRTSRNAEVQARISNINFGTDEQHMTFNCGFTLFCKAFSVEIFFRCRKTLSSVLASVPREIYGFVEHFFFNFDSILCKC